jgi:GT2 family glycosyltransferase
MLIGAVVIGRNEGERLRRCLESIVGRVGCTVYVDSGSTDGSTVVAKSLNARVVPLDLNQPFTAARARNEGAVHLMTVQPATAYIQFVDGDCIVDEGWLTAAAEVLSRDPKVAAVCGRRREVRPEASIYNRLCDMEWDTAVGEAKACGGDAMMRAEAFKGVGGFNPAVIAGEEPELCVRLRAAGWRIQRIEHEMTLHDAAMTSWGQWWRRTLRAGHAYAEGAAMHGAASGAALRARGAEHRVLGRRVASARPGIGVADIGG